MLAKYPKLPYFNSYDRFFPTLDIKPYPSQMELMQAVKKSLDENDRFSNPILIFYKTMLGSGKTSASIALSQFIKEIKKANPEN